jgi:hypothetical protein
MLPATSRHPAGDANRDGKVICVFHAHVTHRTGKWRRKTIEVIMPSTIEEALKTEKVRNKVRLARIGPRIFIFCLPAGPFSTPSAPYTY